MTYGTGIKRARMALQIEKLQAIARLATLSNGMRAVMAGLAKYRPMPDRIAVQRLVLLRRHSMTGIAARLIQPGIRILGNSQHIAMAICTPQRLDRILRHHIPQALRLRPGMACITVIGLFGMFFVDRSTGELVLPIQADHFVQQPMMFIVSVEPLGGGSALTAPLLAKADGVGT